MDSSFTQKWSWIWEHATRLAQNGCLHKKRAQRPSAMRAQTLSEGGEHSHWCLLGNFCLPKNFASAQSCCDYYSGYDCCYPQSHCAQPVVTFNYRRLRLGMFSQLVQLRPHSPPPPLTALLLLKENPYTSGFLCIFALLTEYDRKGGGDVFTPCLMGH